MQVIKVLREAFVVGIMVVIMGFLGSYIASTILPIPLKSEWFNKYHVMELSLFITGFLLHIFLEIFSVNRWYCIYGSACSK